MQFGKQNVFTPKELKLKHPSVQGERMRNHQQEMAYGIYEVVSSFE